MVIHRHHYPRVHCRHQLAALDDDCQQKHRSRLLLEVVHVRRQSRHSRSRLQKHKFQGFISRTERDRLARGRRVLRGRPQDDHRRQAERRQTPTGPSLESKEGSYHSSSGSSTITVCAMQNPLPPVRVESIRLWSSASLSRRTRCTCIQQHH